MPSSPITTGTPDLTGSSNDMSTALTSDVQIGASRTDASASRDRMIQELVELTEDLVDQSLKDDLDYAMATLGELNATVRKLAPSMRPAETAVTLSRVRDAISAGQRADPVGVALAALEIYRVAVRKLPSGGTNSGRTIHLLNHAGLKLIALSRLAQLDWIAANEVLGEITLYALFLDRDTPLAHDCKSLAGSVSVLSDSIAARDRQLFEQSARCIHVIALRLAGQMTDRCS